MTPKTHFHVLMYAIISLFLCKSFLSAKGLTKKYKPTKLWHQTS